MKALIVSLLLVGAAIAGAGDSPDVFIQELSTERAAALPSWLGEPVPATNVTFAKVSFPIKPTEGGTDLAVTFYFKESAGGFLRVFWSGMEKPEMLCANLYEGIGMANRRTLVVKRATLSRAGLLTLQSSEAALNVAKIEWAWVRPASILTAAGAPAVALVKADGRILGEAEVRGDPAPPPADTWRGRVITAPLIGSPERIEAGVEFAATLEAPPHWARLEVKVAGMELGRAVTLWINGARVGELAVEAPDLSDAGYTERSGSDPEYIGWRKATIFVPARHLTAGDNRFQFSWSKPGEPVSTAPVAIKDLLLQLKYPEPAAGGGGAPGPANSRPGSPAADGAVVGPERDQP